MEEKNKEELPLQNACLMVTTLDDNSKDTYLTYIPLHISEIDVEELIKNRSTNNQAVYFQLDCNSKTYWEDMWKKLTEDE